MMTKKQFEQEFRENVMPVVADHYERDGIPDKPARREAWNNVVDAYIKDGALPERAGDWKQPPWLETAIVHPAFPNPRPGMSWMHWGLTALLTTIGVTGLIMGRRARRVPMHTFPPEELRA